MFVRRYLFVFAGLTAISAGPGCTQYYNGALGLSRGDADTARAYQQERAQRDAELEALHQALGGSHEPARIGFDGTTQAELEPVEIDSETSLDGDFTPESRPTLGEKPVFVLAEQDTRPRGPVGVYGDLPGLGGAASPMDSTGPVRRVSHSEEGADFDVTLDPTGENLVFASTRHRETSDIYRQRVDGQAVTQLTDDPANDVMPCVSPDGNSIAFASDRGGNWDLYLMDAEGGPAIQLTRDTTHDIHPSFSPDGSKLVYCSFSERSRQWQLVVIEVNNPATKRYLGHGLFPEWSPAGDTIVFQRARERGTRWFSVWTVELNENGEAGSPTEIAWSAESACITPAWSPDGSAVVFCTVSDPEADSQSSPVSSDVWLVGADGSGRTQLTPGRFANLQPAWSADNTVYFVSNRSREGVENIWAIDSSDALRMVRGRSSVTPATADAPTQTD